MSKVFVIDTTKRPLNPVHPGRARMLLASGQAAVFRRYPFTIILKKEVASPFIEPLRLKFDPGSKTTGLALVNDARGEVVWAAELTHRGEAIKEALNARRAVRHSRRWRHTRYRKPRFLNRRRSRGWLPPSLLSRIVNIETWASRIMRLCPIAAISQELAKFDTQAMQNPEISGIQYQQGTLQGYELREYLLEKWHRRCVYCGKENVPLQIEHIIARARGGTDRPSNLTLSCESCNTAKGAWSIREFLKDKPEVLKHVLAQARVPLKDAAAVNTIRWELYQRLQLTGLPVECGTGGRTKFNRTTRGLEKMHWIDAACVGASTPEILQVKGMVPLLITANGHGNRQMCGTDKFGFPRRHRQRQMHFFGFQTGDIVRATVRKGKYAGVHAGRVLLRATGYFDIQTQRGRVQGINHSCCIVLHRADGYSYQLGTSSKRC
ncbi:MAG TPA: RNA-guided endonuclease IscB [Ktedonobacteraceae bacterium]